MKRNWVRFCEHILQNDWKPEAVGERTQPVQGHARFGSVPVLRCESSKAGVKCLRLDKTGKWVECKERRARSHSPKKTVYQDGGKATEVAKEERAEVKMPTQSDCEAHILSHMKCNCAACMEFACRWRRHLKDEMRSHALHRAEVKPKARRWTYKIGGVTRPCPKFHKDIPCADDGSDCESTVKKWPYVGSPQVNWWFGNYVPSDDSSDDLAVYSSSCSSDESDGDESDDTICRETRRGNGRNRDGRDECDASSSDQSTSDETPERDAGTLHITDLSSENKDVSPAKSREIISTPKRYSKTTITDEDRKKLRKFLWSNNADTSPKRCAEYWEGRSKSTRRLKQGIVCKTPGKPRRALKLTSNLDEFEQVAMEGTMSNGALTDHFRSVICTNPASRMLRMGRFLDCSSGGMRAWKLREKNRLRMKELFRNRQKCFEPKSSFTSCAEREKKKKAGSGADTDESCRETDSETEAFPRHHRDRSENHKGKKEKTKKSKANGRETSKSMSHKEVALEENDTTEEFRRNEENAHQKNHRNVERNMDEKMSERNISSIWNNFKKALKNNKRRKTIPSNATSHRYREITPHRDNSETASETSKFLKKYCVGSTILNKTSPVSSPKRFLQKDDLGFYHIGSQTKLDLTKSQFSHRLVGGYKSKFLRKMGWDNCESYKSDESSEGEPLHTEHQFSSRVKQTSPGMDGEDEADPSMYKTIKIIEGNSFWDGTWLKPEKSEKRAKRQNGADNEEKNQSKIEEQNFLRLQPTTGKVKRSKTAKVHGLSKEKHNFGDMDLSVNNSPVTNAHKKHRSFLADLVDGSTDEFHKDSYYTITNNDRSSQIQPKAEKRKEGPGDIDGKKENGSSEERENDSATGLRLRYGSPPPSSPDTQTRSRYIGQPAPHPQSRHASAQQLDKDRVLWSPWEEDRVSLEAGNTRDRREIGSAKTFERDSHSKRHSQAEGARYVESDDKKGKARSVSSKCSGKRDSRQDLKTESSEADDESDDEDFQTCYGDLDHDYVLTSKWASAKWLEKHKDIHQRRSRVSKCRQPSCKFDNLLPSGVEYVSVARTDADFGLRDQREAKINARNRSMNQRKSPLDETKNCLPLFDRKFSKAKKNSTSPHSRSPGRRRSGPKKRRNSADDDATQSNRSLDRDFRGSRYSNRTFSDKLRLSWDPSFFNVGDRSSSRKQKRSSRKSHQYGSIDSIQIKDGFFPHQRSTYSEFPRLWNRDDHLSREASEKIRNFEPSGSPVKSIASQSHEKERIYQESGKSIDGLKLGDTVHGDYNRTSVKPYGDSTFPNKSSTKTVHVKDAIEVQGPMSQDTERNTLIEINIYGPLEGEPKVEKVDTRSRATQSIAIRSSTATLKDEPLPTDEEEGEHKPSTESGTDSLTNESKKSYGYIGEYKDQDESTNHPIISRAHPNGQQNKSLTKSHKTDKDAKYEVQAGPDNTYLNILRAYTTPYSKSLTATEILDFDKKDAALHYSEQGSKVRTNPKMTNENIVWKSKHEEENVGDKNYIDSQKPKLLQALRDKTITFCSDDLRKNNRDTSKNNEKASRNNGNVQKSTKNDSFKGNKGKQNLGKSVSSSKRINELKPRSRSLSVTRSNDKSFARVRSSIYPFHYESTSKHFGVTGNSGKKSQAKSATNKKQLNARKPSSGKISKYPETIWHKYAREERENQNWSNKILETKYRRARSLSLSREIQNSVGLPRRDRDKEGAEALDHPSKERDELNDMSHEKILGKDGALKESKPGTSSNLAFGKFKSNASKFKNPNLINVKVDTADFTGWAPSAGYQNNSRTAPQTDSREGKPENKIWQHSSVDRVWPIAGRRVPNNKEMVSSLPTAKMVDEPVPKRPSSYCSRSFSFICDESSHTEDNSADDVDNYSEEKHRLHRHKRSSSMRSSRRSRSRYKNKYYTLLRQPNIEPTTYSHKRDRYYSSRGRSRSSCNFLGDKSLASPYTSSSSSTETSAPIEHSFKSNMASTRNRYRPSRPSRRRHKRFAITLPPNTSEIESENWFSTKGIPPFLKFEVENCSKSIKDTPLRQHKSMALDHQHSGIKFFNDRPLARTDQIPYNSYPRIGALSSDDESPANQLLPIGDFRCSSKNHAFRASNRILQESQPSNETQWGDRHISLMGDCSEEHIDHSWRRMSRIEARTKDLEGSMSELKLNFGDIESRLDKVNVIQRNYFTKAEKAIDVVRGRHRKSRNRSRNRSRNSRRGILARLSSSDLDDPETLVGINDARQRLESESSSPCPQQHQAMPKLIRQGTFTRDSSGRIYSDRQGEEFVDKLPSAPTSSRDACDEVNCNQEIERAWLHHNRVQFAGKPASRSRSRNNSGKVRKVKKLSAPVKNYPSDPIIKTSIQDEDISNNHNQESNEHIRNEQNECFQSERVELKRRADMNGCSESFNRNLDHSSKPQKEAHKLRSHPKNVDLSPTCFTTPKMEDRSCNNSNHQQSRDHSNHQRPGDQRKQQLLTWSRILAAHQTAPKNRCSLCGSEADLSKDLWSDATDDEYDDCLRKTKSSLRKVTHTRKDKDHAQVMFNDSSSRPSEDKDVQHAKNKIVKLSHWIKQDSNKDHKSQPDRFCLCSIKDSHSKNNAYKNFARDRIPKRTVKITPKISKAFVNTKRSLSQIYAGPAQSFSKQKNRIVKSMRKRLWLLQQLAKTTKSQSTSKENHETKRPKASSRFKMRNRKVHRYKKRRAYTSSYRDRARKDKSSPIVQEHKKSQKLDRTWHEYLIAKGEESNESSKTCDLLKPRFSSEDGSLTKDATVSTDIDSDKANTKTEQSPRHLSKQLHVHLPSVPESINSSSEISLLNSSAKSHRNGSRSQGNQYQDRSDGPTKETFELLRYTQRDGNNFDIERLNISPLTYNLASPPPPPSSPTDFVYNWENSAIETNSNTTVNNGQRQNLTPSPLSPAPYQRDILRASPVQESLDCRKISGCSLLTADGGCGNLSNYFLQPDDHRAKPLTLNSQIKEQLGLEEASTEKICGVIPGRHRFLSTVCRDEAIMGCGYFTTPREKPQNFDTSDPYIEDIDTSCIPPLSSPRSSSSLSSQHQLELLESLQRSDQLIYNYKINGAAQELDLNSARCSEKHSALQRKTLLPAMDKALPDWSRGLKKTLNSGVSTPRLKGTHKTDSFTQNRRSSSRNGVISNRNRRSRSPYLNVLGRASPNQYQSNFLRSMLLENDMRLSERCDTFHNQTNLQNKKIKNSKINGDFQTRLTSKESKEYIAPKDSYWLSRRSPADENTKLKGSCGDMASSTEWDGAFKRVAAPFNEQSGISREIKLHSLSSPSCRRTSNRLQCSTHRVRFAEPVSHAQSRLDLSDDLIPKTAPNSPQTAADDSGRSVRRTETWENTTRVFSKLSEYSKAATSRRPQSANALTSGRPRDETNLTRLPILPPSCRRMRRESGDSRSLPGTSRRSDDSGCETGGDLDTDTSF
ncbi:hypothetical protein PoB_004941200 [Plakobranchus ocellatus]|uniref:Uncharacterized protein n=1 Tax=Plakobranchus ocellatus TaxID=259542 RepID=A0AAV4BV52_9GAST|nr:hypothetical protein PoB_004941200 [Plakobranchus ocellatus]